MLRSVTDVHPDLLPLARLIPRISVTPRVLRLARWASARAATSPPQVAGVDIEDRWTAGDADAPPVRIRWYRPTSTAEPVPALLWIHGGGYVLGTPDQDHRLLLSMVEELGIAVAAVDYRLAPEHPHPAPLDDCHAALRWLHEGTGLGVCPDRIAIGGASAGGGLAAALTLLAHDRGEVPVAFQLLVYPMLDDRTVTRRGADTSDVRVWTAKSNRFGWQSYLGETPGSPDVSPYAAPARRTDLTGLAPTWIGVGTHDLFHDEDVEYARRLSDAGVDCELEVVPGAYHGFDNVSRRADVVRDFRRSYVAALGAALLAPHSS
jgi:acetyl esterase/lipase